MNKKSVFPLILSSPSGGGKTTIKNYLIKDELFEFSVTCTTRKKRNGEIDGIDYYFLSRDEFDNKIIAGEFLEWAEVHGEKYGTLKKTVDDILLKNKIPVMTIDVVGAINVKKVFPFSLLIFILPPDVKTMIDRLKERGENKKGIIKRMNTAIKEISYVNDFDYVVINDKINDTVDTIISIVNSHFERNYFKRDFVENFRFELEEYLVQNKEEL